MGARRSTRWTSSTRRAARCARCAPTRRLRVSRRVRRAPSLPVDDRGLPDPRPAWATTCSAPTRITWNPELRSRPAGASHASSTSAGCRSHAGHLQHRDRAARSRTRHVASNHDWWEQALVFGSPAPTTSRIASAWRTCPCAAQASSFAGPKCAHAMTATRRSRCCRLRALLSRAPNARRLCVRARPSAGSNG
mgnify:CR=1 FL=1